MQNNFAKGSHVQTGLKTRNSPRLNTALAERERFLEHHPHLRTYQAEIDRVLDKSGDHQGRMAVMGTLMQGKLLQIQQELYKLSKILQKTIKSE